MKSVRSAFWFVHLQVASRWWNSSILVGWISRSVVRRVSAPNAFLAAPFQILLWRTLFSIPHLLTSSCPFCRALNYTTIYKGPKTAEERQKELEVRSIQDVGLSLLGGWKSSGLWEEVSIGTRKGEKVCRQADWSTWNWKKKIIPLVACESFEKQPFKFQLYQFACYNLRFRILCICKLYLSIYSEAVRIYEK